MTTVGDWRLRAVIRRLEKLKGRSVKELTERALQALSAEMEFRGIASTVREMSDSALWSMLDYREFPPRAETVDRVHAHYNEREEPEFFAGLRNGQSAEEMQRPRWANERARLIAAADAVLAGRFHLLGHGELSYGSPIDWHLDPVSHKQAPRVHWSRIPYLDAELVGDHKVIWEVNRHQHFVLLGRAYQVTRDARYAECFVSHLTSWMDANPPKEGVNWASSLEVGYRAIAWLWALELFRGAPCFTPAVLARMLKYLYTHGRHLESYLSTYFSPNTHLTGEAVGLLYLGVLLPEFNRARQWRRLGWRILQEQLGRQIRPDGVYFEQASYYHRYTIDIYLNAIMLGEHNGIPLPPRMRSRLELAAGHLADLTRPDGTIPMIGDDDGGSLLVLEQRDFADVRATLASASLVFEKPEWAVVAGKATEEVLWLFGPEGLEQVDRTIAGEPPAHLSRLFPIGGYAIMRDGWGPAAQHAVIDCGPLGEANCGHAHSDLLSIEIAVAGAPVLVDTGTFTYTASAADRDAFRHSSAHNTLTVDGESAAVPDGPFSWSLKTAAKAESWWTGGLVDRLVASHAGFRRLPDPATHQRTVYFVRGEYWIIVDSLLAAGSHETTAHYHFAPGTVVTPETPAAVRLETTSGGARQSLFFAVAGDVDEVKWEDGWVSPSYGSRTAAPYARAISRGTGRRDIVSVLCPLAPGDRLSVREVEADGGRAVVVDRQGTYDVVMIPTSDEMRMPGVTLHGEGAWVRRASADGAPQAMALFGADSRITVAGVEVTARVAAEARLAGDSWEVEGEGRVVVHG